MAKRDPQEIIGKPFAYSMPLVRAEGDTNAENRTVNMVFSTDKPIRHWFGTLILDHKEESIRLDRLRSNGPFLKNHYWGEKLGRILSAVTNGKQCEAEVRISRNALGEDFMRDYEDDLCTGVSVGFVVHKLQLEEETDEETIYRATDWEPLEISDAHIPADTDCNVLRELELADLEKPKTQTAPEVSVREFQPKEEKEMAAKDESQKTPATASAHAAEFEEIRALGEVFGQHELAEEFILDEKTPQEFRAHLRSLRKKKSAENQPPPEDPKQTAARNGGVELARSIPRIALKNFKGERAQEIAYRFGQFIRAAIFNIDGAKEFCRNNGIMIKRAHSEGDNESGGFLVDTEFENVMIDLRLEYGVFRRNSNVVPMATEKLSRPRRTSGLTAYPIGAKGTSRRITESRKGWDRVLLDAKKWGVLAKYEEELSEDAVINLGDDLMGEIVFAFTQMEDECGFKGDGSSDYHGITGVIPKLLGLNGTIANIAGLVVASGNAWSEIALIDILTLVGRLPSFARRTGQVKWYCTSEFWATVLCRIALAAGGNAMQSFQGELLPAFLGKPVEFVEVMPHVEGNSEICLLYGNLVLASMFGDRRGATIKMTDSNDTDFEEDLIAIKGTERFDINVHDVGNASATPSQRKAGPIVGLITAAS